MKHIDAIENCSIVAGVSVGLMDIYSLLGIIVLSFQILLILLKLITRVYTAIKNKNVDEINNAINDAQKGLEEFEKQINDNKPKK